MTTLLREDMHRAFLADILAHPDEDAPRLIFADWLEEYGDEARAEFIRVQIELARLGQVVCKWGVVLQGYGDFKRRCRCAACTLKRREYLSSQQHIVWDWLGGVGVAPSFVCYNDWRRGFVESVTTTLDSWRAEGPALVRTQPIVRVNCLNKFPWERWEDESQNTWRWYRQDEGGIGQNFVREVQLPGDLWHLVHDPLESWQFKSREAALDALSRGCIAWAKRQHSEVAR